MKSFSESYKAAGVDITAGYTAVELMKKHIARTTTPGAIGGVGGFGGLFQPDLSGMKTPILVSGTDGVGTKLKIAFLMDKHDTVGIDCVAMSVNDVVCCGAQPLFFLDYIAIGKNEPEKVASLVAGVAEGCVRAGCALIGGETAEMPGFYPEDEYDLAGFSVGIVDEQQIIDPEQRMKEGDVLVGMTSSGVHSNGFSLVRKVLDIENHYNDHYPSLGCTLGEALLAPTTIYVRAILSMLKDGVDIHGISHITGGGFFENVPRMMKKGLTARINPLSFPRLPIFDIIKEAGNIPTRDMYNTFNMGIGMIVAVPKDQVSLAMGTAVRAGQHAYVIGSVVKGEEGKRGVIVEGIGEA